MAKLDLTQTTDAEIQRRLDFADKLINALIEHNKPGILPDHLEQERQELLAEKRKRQHIEEVGLQL
jgi:hypothetical protein